MSEVIRDSLLDADGLVRAVAGGRQRGTEPRWRRVEVRYVDLARGRHLQVTSYDDTQAHTANHPLEEARAVVAGLLAEAYGHWHVETTTQVHQLRVTKKGRPLLHSQRQAQPVEQDRDHDRSKPRLLDPADPVFVALGISDAQGRVKPSRQAKLRQVEEFLRQLETALPDHDRPLRVVDLGCGNAYLTFAAHRFLTERGHAVELVGVDVKEQSRDHNEDVARELGIDATFVVGAIGTVALEAPDVVLALHACDTATDEALARAVEWQAEVVLAAPCCHHDIAAQLRRTPTPAPYDLLTRDGILRERLADTLTDGLRASLLRQAGYRVDVVEFVGSEHTPRNTLLRAVRTGVSAGREEYDDLVAAWGVRPWLAELLA